MDHCCRVNKQGSAPATLAGPLASIDGHALVLRVAAFGSSQRGVENDVAHFINTAHRLGFSLAEVAGLPRLDDGAPCREAREKAEHALAGVRARLNDLSRMERALSELVKRCRKARDDVQCPLIAALRQRGLGPDDTR